ncbi:hypothetical protein JOM56_005777 [Amanita muscaria]
MLKEPHHLLLSRMGMPSNHSSTVPSSQIVPLFSPIIPSTIKSEFPSFQLNGIPRYDQNEMKPVEFFQARHDILQVLFAPAFTPHENHEERVAEDYPDVSYWHPSNYHSNGIDSSHLSDKIAYLEDENGHIMDKKRVAQICADLRSNFNQIMNNLPRTLQSKWTQYDIDFQQIVFRYLRTKYEEFTLCDDNWKARSFVSNWYLNWIKNWKKKEHQPVTSKDVMKSIPSKRRTDDIPGSSKPRQRFKSEASTSAHLSKRRTDDIPGPSKPRQRFESEASKHRTPDDIVGPSKPRQRSGSDASISTQSHQSSEEVQVLVP